MDIVIICAICLRVNALSAELAYLSSLTPVDYALTILLGVLGVIGVIMLFQLKSAALPIFLVALALNGTYSVWTLLMNPAFRETLHEGLIGMMMGFASLCLISFYVHRLQVRGLLR
ncbi:MAG: hypothetical protein ACREJN_07620 [Nitrospiraceae bacterium]